MIKLFLVQKYTYDLLMIILLERAVKNSSCITNVYNSIFENQLHPKKKVLSI